jgi:hypothetical protein
MNDISKPITKSEVVGLDRILLKHSRSKHSGLDALTQATALALNAPIALFFVHSHNEYKLKSMAGAPDDLVYNLAEIICARAACSDGFFEINNLNAIPRLATNPEISNLASFNYCAGIAINIFNSTGKAVLCIINENQKKYKQAQGTIITAFPICQCIPRIRKRQRIATK